jgi:hypothetical protein
MARKIEGVGDAVIQLRGNAGYVAKIAVNETVVPGAADVKAIVKAPYGRAAPRTEMRSERAEGIQISIHLIADWSAGRLAGHVIDRTADGVESGHQG